MSLSTLTSKGQTTIPRDVRAFLKIQSGDRLEFVIGQDGNVILKPAVIEVSEIRGLLKQHKRGKTVTLDDMKSAVRQKWKKLP